MGASASTERQRARPFIPGEFTVAWLTFKGDSVEDTDHRYIAKKDGLLSSKLLKGLFGDAIMKGFADFDGDYITREHFICTLVQRYEGNTEDRISYMFTMYSIIYGLDREREPSILRKDYNYLLEYLATINVIPKKLYAVFDECAIPMTGMLSNSQFVEWVRQYSVLMDFLASHLPPTIGPMSPFGGGPHDEFLNPSDPLNSSPSCRDKTNSAFGSFDFIGGEDSGDDSDEAYDSDQISEMEEFGAFQSASMVADESGGDAQGDDGSDPSDGEDLVDMTPSARMDPLTASGSGRRNSRGSRSRGGVQKMGRNITKGISKVGRTILHGGKGYPHGDHPNDPTSAALFAAGYAFSSESHMSKNYVCGYLHKISDGKWSKRSWHRRWFVLDRQQGVLSYYRHNPANLITATPRGNIVHLEEEEQARDFPRSKSADSKLPSELSVSSTRNQPQARGSTGSTLSTIASPQSTPAAVAGIANGASQHPQHMLYLNKSHPWYRGELNLNQDSVSLLFEKSLARNAPTRYFFQVSTLALQEIDSKRGTQYKLCAENEEEFDQWTRAIAEAINRKHTEQSVTRSTPPLSHQQLYRQRLLQEQQQKEQEQLRRESSDASSVTASTTAAVASSGTPPAASPSSSVSPRASEAESKPSRRESTSKDSFVPPRIVTFAPSQTFSPQAQWKFQVSIEGSKQCLILGFMVNIVALKLIAAEHAFSKLLICMAVSGAYVMSVYNPNPYVHSPSVHIPSDGSPQGVDPSLLETEGGEMCSDPEQCCLHKPRRRNSGLGHPVDNDCGHVPLAPALAVPPAGGFKKFQLGSSMTRSEMLTSGRSSKKAHSYAQARAETFVVRSLDYKKTKRKEASQGALFEFIGADLLRTTRKTDLLSQRIELPEEYTGEKLFVINAQLPSYGPSVWGDASYDGPGYSMVMCWRIPSEICEELKEPKTKTIRLLKRFLEAGNDTSLTDRFKVIAQVTNQDDCGLSGMAKKLLVTHNATPVLTRPQHRIYHFDDGSTEVVIDVHAFSYIARRGIYMLLDKTAKLVIDVAFVLQGEAEDELPERILGCCRLDSLEAHKAMDLPR
ncbi:hypothetical protein Poli38472_009587 [Pythium oligandrum]|uniref:PH domain-containing protein n=1 Tax=Pythium oligandrum TaxID=41045 RepID=A0A8K1CER0_PYTOL|nr:hypothetical protein Poli38472_009587 [Pythium oligandrum]|eukprot:TMW62094.1 hypothetical protein Poli38472_009587 [Pythium oligandrum]